MSGLPLGFRHHRLHAYEADGVLGVPVPVRLYGLRAASLGLASRLRHVWGYRLSVTVEGVLPHFR
jgi:hypothetical protein